MGLCGVEGAVEDRMGTVDSKAGAGWLGGQPAVYLRAQLEAISSGARHNDIGEHMGNIVR